MASRFSLPKIPGAPKSFKELAGKLAPKTTEKVQTGLSTGAARAAERKAKVTAKREAAGKLPRQGVISGAASIARQFPKTTAIGVGVPAAFIGSNIAYDKATAPEELDLLALTSGGQSAFDKQIATIEEAFAQNPELESYLRGMNTAVQESGAEMYADKGRPDLAERYRIQQQGELQRMLLADRLQREAAKSEAIANAKLANIGTPTPLVTAESATPALQAWEAAGEESQKAWAQANGFDNINEARNAYVRSQLGL